MIGIFDIVLAGGMFYAGMKYNQSQSPVFTRGVGGNFAVLGGQGARNANMRGGAGGMVSGEIIAKDDQSITVKLRDGGSKIVFLSSTIEVSKFDKGSAADLEIGKSVSVNGTTNADGSVTAQTIQLRPEQVVRPAPIN